MNVSILFTAINFQIQSFWRKQNSSIDNGNWLDLLYFKYICCTIKIYEAKFLAQCAQNIFEIKF